MAVIPKSIKKTFIFLILLLTLPAIVSLVESGRDEVVAKNDSNEAGSVHEETEIIFVGDMMFDRHVREKAERFGYEEIFRDVSDLFLESDYVVGNLEGPVTPNQSVSRNSRIGSPQNTQFTFSPEVPKALFKQNVSIVNLGNNHIFDFGREGVHSTTAALKEAGISYFGNPLESASHTVEDEGNKIALINYNEFFGPEAYDVAKEITKLKEGGHLVFVYTHWGVEYESEPTERVRELARSFVEAGADMVIGTHSHVEGISEEYNGKSIYYSLGNFVFDQYWERAVREGLMLKVKIKDNRIASVEEIRTSVSKENPTVRIISR